MNAPGDLSRLTPQLEGRVSAEEWQARLDLAAAYRLVALFRWDDLVFTHITAQDPGHRALPDQPVRADVRRDHGVEPDQDRHPGQGAAGDAVPDQSRRLRHPQRGALGAPRRAMRDAHAHAERRRRLGAKGRRAADLAVLDLRPRQPRLSRLRRRRPARRGKAAPRRRPRQQDLPHAAQPRPADRRQERRRGVRGDVHVRDDLRGADPRPGRRQRWRPAS